MNPRKLNVFYADDDPDDIDFFKDAVAIANENVNVITQFDAGVLLQMLNDPPSGSIIVFLDWNMPGKNGAYVLKEVRSDEHYKHIPIVILSTSNNKNNINEARKLGANYYITKPGSFRELVLAIKHCLEINWKQFEPNEHQFYYNNNI